LFLCFFTFFMLFLAATNDRNHGMSPPNNIKLIPHSILYYFVYFASYFVSVYVVLWPMMNNLMNNMFIMLLIIPWDTFIPILSNMGWMSLTVPWLTWTCFSYTSNLFWGLLVLFCPCCHAYDDLVCLMPPIKTCETSMPMFFQYWVGCLTCFHGCHD
jgi:hypothetical protein